MIRLYAVTGLAATSAGLFAYTLYATFNSTVEGLKLVAMMAAL